MLTNKLRQVYGIISIALATVVTVLFIDNPGTNDVITWLNWMNNLTQHSLVNGYTINGADYPPFSSLILFGVGKLANGLQLDSFLTLKYSLLTALLASTTLFYVWTRNLYLALAFHFALLLNSLGLVYLDIYFVPSLILSFWALQKNRWLLTTVCLSITILIKWQALIFLPFVLVYFLHIDLLSQWRSIPWRRILWQVTIPAFALTVFSLVWFGPEVVNAFLRATTGHHYLSANALNINWVISYWLHSFQSTTYGLEMKVITLQPTSWLFMMIKVVFVMAYVLVLLKFCLVKKTYVHLLLYSVLASCTYFMVNVGVHENHLIVPLVLTGLLAAAQTECRPLFMIIAVCTNLNFALFYISGLFTTYYIGVLPMSVVFALLNSSLFLLFYYGVIKSKLWQQ